MREMRKTGIPWLPELAEDFSVGYVKQYFYISKDLSNEGEPERVLKLARAGIVEKDVTTNEGQMAASYSGYNKVKAGDLLLNPMDLYSGANCNVSELNGVISPAYSNLRAKKASLVVPKFYDYYFKSQYWLMAMFAHGKGVSFDNRWTLNNDSLRAYEIPVAPYVVQQRIVERIQAEERKVDALIEKLQEQIEKLKAYKQSLITEVVTKGLNPSVPMKDSGVEWLGEIPEHWEVTRIKNLFDLRNERNDEADLSKVNLISLYTDLGVVQHSDIVETTGNRAVTAEGYKFVHKNDIVVNIILCWMGAVGMSNYDGVTSPAYDIYRPKEGTLSEYYHYLFRTKRFNGECYRYGRGIMMMRWRTYSTEFRAIDIPCPPHDEQVAIIEHLKAKSYQIDQLIAIKQKKIDKLNDYKKSLIYEYVTGKKEVL